MEETEDNIFSTVPMAPSDMIYGAYVAYMKDTNPNKVNLTVGAYRNENGGPYLFKSVKKAE